MKKILISFLSILIASASLVASAQSVSISCTNLNSAMSYGSSGENVTALQIFLHEKSYLSAAPTGYFGNLTVLAVKAFQKANNISAVGSVGPLTRAVIKNVSCNTIPAPIVATTSAATNFPIAPLSIQTTLSATTSPAIIHPIISSESSVSGAPGSAVYLYGSGFDQNSNVIFCGSQVASALLSPNAISFTVPTNIPTGDCHIQINETNGNSASVLSNAEYFIALPAIIVATSTTPAITSVSVNGSAGAALFPGATVIILGSNFSPNATVILDNVPLLGRTSTDGTTITFTAPSFAPNTYNLSVTESAGQSNILPVSMTTASVGGLSVTLASSSASVSNGAVDLGDYIFTNTGTTTAVVTSLTLQEGGSATSYSNPVLTNIYLVNQYGSTIGNAPGALTAGASVTFNGSPTLFLVPSGGSVTIGVHGGLNSYQPTPSELNVNLSIRSVSANVWVSGYPLTGATVNIF